MRKHYNKSAYNADVLFGVLALLTAIFSPVVIWLTVFISAFASFAFAWQLFWSAMLFPVVTGVLGIRALMRAERSKKYLRLFEAEPNVTWFRISQLQLSMNRSLKSLSSDLHTLKKRGYFKTLLFDLERKEIGISSNNEVIVADKAHSAYSRGSNYNADIGSDQLSIYKPVRGLPISAFFAGGSTTLACISFMGAFSLIPGAIAFGLGLWFFPFPWYLAEVVEPSPKIALTGDELVDETLGAIKKTIDEFNERSKKQANSKLRPDLLTSASILEQIAKYISENPDKSKHLRQFTNYYLPTTIELLSSYEELVSKPDQIKGKNILSAITKIEDTIANMPDVLKKEYDELFADKALDISAEISVMSNIVDNMQFTIDD